MQWMSRRPAGLAERQSVNYKDNGRGIAGQSVALKEEAEAESEAAAIKDLAPGSGPFR